MNGNDNEQLQHQVYVNHGWDRMRCARNFSTDKAYQTYNRMQLIKGAKSAMYQGDTYIFDEGEIIAIFEGIKVIKIMPIRFYSFQEILKELIVPRGTASSFRSPPPIQKGGRYKDTW
jgi:hypothetical protein